MFLPVPFDQLNPTILTSLDNLNNITKNGYYTWASSTHPTNVPFSDASCFMEVTDFATTEYCIQRVYAPYKFATRYMKRDGTIGDWYIYWNKENIQTAIRSEFAFRKLEISSSSSIGSGKIFTVFRSGNGFNFATIINIPSGSYTCTIQMGSTTTTKYLALGTVSHSNVKNWMLNRYDANTTIDDVPIHNSISLGTGVVIWNNDTKVTTTSAYLVRTSSSQWTLCSTVAGTTNTSWKWEPSTSFSFRPFSSISSTTIVANSYDTNVWE